MIRRAAGAGILAALVVVAGCSDGESASEVPPATSTSSTTSAVPTTSSATSAVPAVPSGPVWTSDFPDPFLLSRDGIHHAYATASGFLRAQHLSSPDFSPWAGPADVLPGAPSWATPLSAWAPAVLQRPGSDVLFFSAQVAGTDMHCVGSAVASGAEGPFVPDGDEPIVCPRHLGGAIDPSPFVDADGAVHLLWKNDGVTLRQESAIWSQRLSADGRSLESDPVELIRTDQRWEYPHVEAPSMARVGDTYWLAYSGNWWNQEAYGVGLARCESPVGPCVKPFDGPVLSSREGASGPGGAEFFRDRHGRLLVAYHAWLGPPGYPGSRALHVAAVDVLGIEP